MTNSLSERFGFSKPGKAKRGSASGSSFVRPGNLHAPSPPPALFSAKVFPSGDFSVGAVPPERMRRTDKEYERTKGDILLKTVEWEEKGETWHETAVIASPTLPPRTNLVSGTKSSQVRSRYGTKGITGYGKKMVRSAAAILERRWGNSNTGFGTVTVPALDAEQLKTLCANWGEVVRRFFQELRREQLRKGADADYVSVTEIQQSRYSRRAEVGLHLHFVYQAKLSRKAPYLLKADWLRRVWRAILCRVLRIPVKQMQTPRCNLQIVKKSAAGYLGKYLSKGAESVERIVTSGFVDCLPRQWWNISCKLSLHVRSRILRIRGDIAYSIFKAASGSESWFPVFWSRPTTYYADSGREIVCGYSGRTCYLTVKNCFSILDD